MMLGCSLFILQCIVIFCVITLFGFSIKEVSSQSLQPLSYRIKQEKNKCPGQFQCTNGQCIDAFDVCDGTKNCDDGSDEKQYTCLKNNVTSKTCDGETNCVDNSDELLLRCPGVNWAPNPSKKKCKSNEFQCRDGQCINMYVTCDGTPDCQDKSDETITQCNQENFGCHHQNFRCAYGACIDESSKCDGKVDCADGSDEDNMLCGFNFNTTSQKPPVSVSSGNCVLPPFSIGTKYSRHKCSSFEECDAIEENKIIDTYKHIFINCKEGFALAEEDNFIAICRDGRWQPKNTACVRLCKPRKSTSLNIFCEYAGASVNCEEPMRTGTIAKLICRDGYYQELSALDFEDRCQPNGEWLYNGIQSCSLKCGELKHQEKLISDGITANKTYHPWNAGIYRVLKNGTTLHICGGTLISPFSVLTECGELKHQEKLISDGITANKTYHPWNAGIYRVLKNGTTLHICGGTLISPFSVLTAAHCVTNITDGRLIAAKKFKITFAKQFIKYNDPGDTDAVYRNVLRIHVPLEYQGNVLNYLSDVAILELTSSVPLGESIMPACVDKYNENIIRSSMLGTVVGWGRDSNNMPAEQLQRAELSFITLEECRNLLINEDRVHITNDKFCTLKRSGSNTAVQTGDSGSGITFEFGGKHYLYGVISTKINRSNTAVQQGDSGSGVTFKFGGKHYLYGVVSTKLNSVTDTFTNIQFKMNLNFIKETMINIAKNNGI
ncbi:modular serine protease-like isoform X2 [Lycorma delicatula]|uniref:modular serine protease-like isoform X2 n=1 Tax=Lycorma delicatula TaxID=130591 RepID=UPI003F5147CC